VKHAAIVWAFGRALSIGSTIVLVCFTLLPGCSPEGQDQTLQSIPEATAVATAQTESTAAFDEVHAGLDCPEIESSSVSPSIRLVKGSLAVHDLCALAHLYDLVSKGEPVNVEVAYPSRVTDIVRAGGERQSGPEVEFARVWARHRSETEVGLVRLAAMLSATPPANGGTIDRYRKRMMSTLRQGTVSRLVAARLRNVATMDDLIILDVDSGAKIDKQAYLESLDRMAENSEVDAVSASLALRYHLGEGRTDTAVSAGLAIRTLENYLQLRSDRLFSAMYGNVRSEDVAAMGKDWDAFIGIVIRRDFEDSVREVDPEVTADAIWFECGGDALPGAPYNYGRFMFPPQQLSSDWSEKMRSGPWPVGPATEGFTAEAWARFAVWQMLARESGNFADIMSLYREDMYRCGPP